MICTFLLLPFVSVPFFIRGPKGGEACKNAQEELLVIDRTYQLLKWYEGSLAKFPRSHRYGLGQQIEQRSYAAFNDLLRAKYGTGVGQATRR